MDGEHGPYDLSARRLLQRLRRPSTLESDRTGVALRDALGTATVYDAVLTCAERAFTNADARIGTIVRRCDLGGEPMKAVAGDLHVSLRHFFRYRGEAIRAFGAEMQRVIELRVPVPRDEAKALGMRRLATASFLLGRASRGDDLRALAAAESALAADPSLHEAWCAIAAANISLALRAALGSADAYARAAAALERASALAPRSGIVHGARSTLVLWSTRDHALARAVANQAVDSPSGRARGYATLGWISALDGSFDEAERCFIAAVAADPRAWTFHTSGVAMLHLRGDFERCAVRCAELHAIEPEDSYILGYYAETLNAQARYEETIAVVEAAPAAARDFAVMTALTRARALAGDTATARTDAHRFHGPAVSVAALALTIGEEDRAWRALERAREERSTMLHLVPYDPVFEPLRDEPRFKAVTR